MIYTDPRLLSAELVGGTVSRHEGNMRATEAQTPVYEKLGVPPARMLHFRQTHSTRIITINSPDEAQQFQRRPTQEADAWVFTTAGWGAAILTADCVPLLLWAQDGSAFALAHCGWRGVVNKLPLLTAQALQQKTADRPLYAWLGPHIQSCCFEVQNDVAEQFSPANVLHKDGKLFVDLTCEIRRQLYQTGLKPEAIASPYYCTCGDKANFFSWRRDHLKENLLSFIYKP